MSKDEKSFGRLFVEEVADLGRTFIDTVTGNERPKSSSTKSDRDRKKEDSEPTRTGPAYD